MDRAQGEANIALDRYEAKQQEYTDAQAKAKAADDAAAKAAADLGVAQAAVADFARTSYMSGSTSPSMEGLMTSGSPAQLLERAALLDAAGNHRSDVVTQVTVVRKQAVVAAAGAKTALDQGRRPSRRRRRPPWPAPSRWRPGPAAGRDRAGPAGGPAGPAQQAQQTLSR